MVSVRQEFEMDIDENIGKKVDLHMHSTFSDGVFTPTELVELRKKEGYDVIAITDHDGCKGVPEALAAGEKAGVRVIPGIEIGTVDADGRENHILGYGIDPENKLLLDKMQVIKEFRDNRNKKLLGYFQEKGFDIKYEDLIKKPDQEYVAKPDFAWVFVNRGYVQTVSEAFKSEKFLAAKAVQRLKQMPYPVDEAIGLIKGAGGVAVLAHPMKLKMLGEKSSDEFFDNLKEHLKMLIGYGLYGIECYHPSASEEDSKRLVELAKELGLKITRGSDYHGPENKKRA